MKVTFNDYIQNPAGKQNAVFSQREMYRAVYSSKLDKVLLRENNKIDYYLYHKNDEYYIHMKVPSEVVEKFYYDVVIKFYTDNNALKVAPSLQNYYVQFYSNDPAFVYTYAHTFMNNELFIDELKPKMSKIAIKKSAEIRNPNDVVGYVKSLFFCYLIMKNKGLFAKIKYTTYGKKFDKKLLLASVEDADKKIEKRKELGQQKQKENLKKPTESKPDSDRDHTVKSSTKSKIASKVKTVKTVKQTKKTGFVKKK